MPTPVSAGTPDLVVLSHLRWPWVWQRPHHLVARLARLRTAEGARTYFVEEPVAGDVAAPELHQEERDGITRIWLVLPGAGRSEPWLGFDAAGAEEYGELLRAFLAAAGRPMNPDVWLYTPMARDIAVALSPGRLAYDVMDDLASFKDASAALVLRQRQVLHEADVVFAGGRSLHRSVLAHGRPDCHLFPSGVESAFFAQSRALRRPHPRPVAGFVGVIDERMDLTLVSELARALPDWTVRLVGPVAKIDPADLPQGPNVEYPGKAEYQRLPEVLAGFDVALMPFALNEATASISPTKTLEYLAAGLPVVSTRVPDVVADYRHVVHLADDAAGFAAACRLLAGQPSDERDRKSRGIRAAQEWDAIADEMAQLFAATPLVVDVRDAPGMAVGMTVGILPVPVGGDVSA